MKASEMLMIHDKIKRLLVDRNDYPNIKIYEEIVKENSGMIYIFDENDKTYCCISSFNLSAENLIQDKHPEDFKNYNLASFR
ncbi:MAG: hypothetical protein J6R47_03535 [Acholeplasmatales bacterium]|nr:hypothetical protein [Acholeplasmatales bacterium]